MKTVYLAGPITGCDRPEANDWRKYVSNQLAIYGIKGISPLRCEPLVGERYSPTHADPRFGTARAIASKNFFDVQHTDMTFVYLPREFNDRRPSYGTVGELFWASALRKPTILVTDCPILAEHPVINAAAGWLLNDIDQGIDVVVGLLEDYARRLPS